MRDKEEIKRMVREGYAQIARQGSSCCGATSACCGAGNQAEILSQRIGYSPAEISAVPVGTNLGLGCGNPLALAALQTGETVLDLGSGAGFDCLLAARKVGPTGKVIGVDMTPEMVAKARYNALQGGYPNVEFRLGEIEHLPVADESVDVIISNCVINLTPDKEQVFREAFRVLKPGGRLLIADIVLLQELPAVIKQSVAAYVGCLSGAILKEAYLTAIQAAGFQEVRLVEESHFPVEYMAEDPTAQAVTTNPDIPHTIVEEIAGTVVSIRVTAAKPGRPAATK